MSHTLLRNFENDSWKRRLAALATACVLTVGPFGRAVPPRATPDSQFSTAEQSELLQAMVFLMCKREEPLVKRMEQLSPYHNLLIRSWLLSGRPDVLSVENQIGKSTPMSLLAKYPDEYAEFAKSWEAGLAKFSERKSTEEERRQKTIYWDQMAQAALEVLNEHLNSDMHSDHFISGAVLAIDWLRLSADKQEDAYDALQSALRQAKSPELRHAIFKSLFLFRNRHPDVFQSLLHDTDLQISQAATAELVSHGDATYLPAYVHQTWRLFKSERDRRDALLGAPKDLQHLLEELIPDSGLLLSEQSQLSWLEKNLHALQWDKGKKAYRLMK